MTWDSSKPLGSAPRSQGDDAMRNNFSWLELALPGCMTFPTPIDALGRAKLPRYTKSERDALVPFDRMIILRKDRPAIEYYDAATSSWITYEFAMVGEIRMLSFDTVDPTPPEGWVPCDGRSLVRTTYAQLFAVIGTAWGAPTASTFNVPNFGGKLLVGRNGSDPDFDNIADEGGVKEVTLAADELAAHDHAVSTEPDHTHTYDLWSQASVTGGQQTLKQGTSSIGTEGMEGATKGDHTHVVNEDGQSRGDAHNNVQKHIVHQTMIYAGYVA